MTKKKEMKFPSEKEYLKGIKKIHDLEKQERTSLNLISGNCGSFAIALKKVFGKGELLALWGEGDNSYDPGFSHVLLKVEKKLYDGIGIHDLEEEYEYYPETSNQPLITDEKYITKNLKKFTMRQNPPKFFVEIIKKAFIQE